MGDQSVESRSFWLRSRRFRCALPCEQRALFMGPQTRSAQDDNFQRLTSGH